MVLSKLLITDVSLSLLLAKLPVKELTLFNDFARAPVWVFNKVCKDADDDVNHDDVYHDMRMMLIMMIRMMRMLRMLRRACE